MEAGTRLGFAGLSIIALFATTACGGDDTKQSKAGETSGPFTPTKPPDDPCALLDMSDVQSILPAAGAGAPEPTEDTPDDWTRTCKWKGAELDSVELVLFGALTSNGQQLLGILSTRIGNGTKMPVSGLGDAATYWEDSGVNTRGLTAKKTNYVADVTAYFLDPAPTEGQFEPLVRKALDQL